MGRSAHFYGPRAFAAPDRADPARRSATTRRTSEQRPDAAPGGRTGGLSRAPSRTRNPTEWHAGRPLLSGGQELGVTPCPGEGISVGSSPTCQSAQ